MAALKDPLSRSSPLLGEYLVTIFTSILARKRVKDCSRGYIRELQSKYKRSYESEVGD